MGKLANQSFNSNRRRLLVAAGTVGAATVLGPSLTLAEWLDLTPSQPEGPFYAPFRPLSIDNDLVHLPGNSTAAKGEVIYVSGRVLDQRARPIQGARVEVWQANKFGRYNHPRDAASNLALDPNFQGVGHDQSDREGRYQFKTIKPGPYPAAPGWRRPPHIHYKAVLPNGGTWTTQLYFAGEPLNEKDYLLGRLGKAGVNLVRPIKPVARDDGNKAGIVEFDIVLGQPGVALKPT